ncbi:hypothetical protein D3C85_110370 [compost metagenome]
MEKFKTLLLLIYILTSAIVLGQTKKATTKKAKPEIDVLYENYKNSKSITLYTSSGEITGGVIVEKNSENKPVSIKISGSSSNKNSVSEFINNTIAMKKKQGYKIYESSPYGIDYELEHSFQGKDGFHLVMKKGNMYFRSDATRNSEIRVRITGIGDRYDTETNYTWEIETGDSSRKGGKEAKEFKF